MSLLLYNCYSLQECANSKVTIGTTSVTLVPSRYTETIGPIVHSIRNEAGKERGVGEKGDRSPAMRTTGNNMSNCTMHNTRINTCSRKAAIVLLHGRVKWYDFVAMNNMKTEFASIDFSVNNVVSSPSFIFNLKLALSNHLFFLSSKFSSYTTEM